MNDGDVALRLLSKLLVKLRTIIGAPETLPAAS
jgi:hypothetical protein